MLYVDTTHNTFLQFLQYNKALSTVLPFIFRLINFSWNTTGTVRSNKIDYSPGELNAIRDIATPLLRAVQNSADSLKIANIFANLLRAVQGWDSAEQNNVVYYQF